MLKWGARAFGALVVIGAVVFFGVLPGHVEKGQNRLVTHAPYPVSEEARALHASLVIGDLHSDSLLWNRDLFAHGRRGHVDLPRLRQGNVAVQVFTTVTKSPAGQNYEENAADARDNITLLGIAQLWPIKTWNNLTERGLYMAKRLTDMEKTAPNEIRVLRTKGDLEAVLAARENGEQIIGGLIGAEGGHVLEANIAELDRLFDAGFRLIGLTHFFDNALGGSLHGESGHGLTDFGREVVREMVARGMIIDLAHASPQMARDVLAMTDVPLMVSHTGLYSNCPVKRNFPDALMQQIAQTGGIIGIGYWEDVTCDATPAGIAKTIAAAIDVVGADSVALGSDFDGAVETHLDASELPALTQALIDEGLSTDQIEAVMGRNMMRYLADVLPE